MILCLVSAWRSSDGIVRLWSNKLTDTRRGEIILGFYVRAGAWVDGIEILTSQGRKSGIYGNASGGSGYEQACFCLVTKPAFLTEIQIHSDPPTWL